MQPMYRTTRDLTFVNGCPYNAGAEIRHYGWPKQQDALEPINEAAGRIAGYYALRWMDPWLPKSPVDGATGKIYLPGLLRARRGQDKASAIPAEEAMPLMPIYRVTTFGGDSFAGIFFQQNAEIALLGWPERGVEPVNDAARRVSAYFEAAGGFEAIHNLPPSPWNMFDNSLWLPDLQPRQDVVEVPATRKPSPIARQVYEPFVQART